MIQKQVGYRIQDTEQVGYKIWDTGAGIGYWSQDQDTSGRIQDTGYRIQGQVGY